MQAGKAHNRGDWLKFTARAISIFYMLSLAAWLSGSLWGKSVTSRCITVQRCSRGLLKGPQWWASSDCLVTACQWWAVLPLTHGWSIRADRFWNPPQIVFLDVKFERIPPVCYYLSKKYTLFSFTYKVVVGWVMTSDVSVQWAKFDLNGNRL